MGRVIVIEYVTLDGVVQDPSGAEGTAFGGWAFRREAGPLTADKFRLGTIMETGELLMGRVTWELFARLWPGRTGEFADRMNGMPKLVASRSLTSVGAWAHSTLLDGELGDVVDRRRHDHDVVVIGSTSVVQALAARDLVDEYRFLLCPTVVGEGARLFADGGRGAELQLTDVQPAGAAVLLTYERLGAMPAAEASPAA
jgi:dihydrofolate reductase